MPFSEENFCDMLPLYYKRLFPYGPYFDWLNYGGFHPKHIEDLHPKYIENREFSFTLANDVYIRYQSFDKQEDFEKEVKSVCPLKIDIGAVYSLKPRDHRLKTQFQAMEKELVFDIDMTDYDDVRSCCSGADVCSKCWKFMCVACRILEAALKEDFGWEHRLWVFSGRRGVHCWVCDESARKLDTSSRSAVAEYLQLLSGGDKQAKKVFLLSDTIHPSINRALNIIKETFVEMCVQEQDMLGSKESCQKFLKIVTDEELRNMLDKEFQNVSSSLERWNAFINAANIINRKNSFKRIKTRNIVEEIMLQYSYPRLDINVTKGLNHLLKSPFCVHPKTGKVCIPFVARNVDSFDVNTVPTISGLLDEIAEYDKKLMEVHGNTDSNVKVKDYKKTSLIKSVSIFEQFLKPMMQEWKMKRQEMKDQNMEF